MQRLTQVITNLLANAVKFTPEKGSISLRIENIKDSAASCTLFFEVSDTGIGISETHQQKLWRLFEQADGSVSRRFGGTGLGLAITKNIIFMEDIAHCLSVGMNEHVGKPLDKDEVISKLKLFL